MIASALFPLSFLMASTQATAQVDEVAYPPPFEDFFVCHEMMTEEGLQTGGFEGLGWQASQQRGPLTIYRHDEREGWITLGEETASGPVCVASLVVEDPAEFDTFLAAFGDDLPPTDDNKSTGFRSGHRLVTLQLADIDGLLVIHAFVVLAPEAEEAKS